MPSAYLVQSPEAQFVVVNRRDRAPSSFDRLPCLFRHSADLHKEASTRREDRDYPFQNVSDKNDDSLPNNGIVVKEGVA